MRICCVMKYPPIQGGVSARCYWLARSLAERGHQITVVTNASEVESEYRIWLGAEDFGRLEARFDSGGSVRVAATGHFQHRAWHIPYANPYLTKLAAVATEEIRRVDAEVVFSSYFEPYSMAAHLAATWTDVPHVVQHAGSDRTRLMDHPELSTAYREMLRRASILVTGDLDLRGLGIPTDRFARIRHGQLPAEFNVEGPILDIDELLQRALAEGAAADGVNTGRIDTDAVTIGIYGKLGEPKGSYDLISALAVLRDRGRRFNLVALTNGRERSKFIERIRLANLFDRVWVLPFIPHWRVPEFIRACTAVCFLERDFPVEIHTPSVPREVMACGTCLVLSGEVARKQWRFSEFRDGENVLLVEDPRNVDSLVSVLDRVVLDPAAARKIGRAGHALHTPQGTEELGEIYEGLFRRAIADGRSPRHTSVGVPAAALESEVLGLLCRYMPITFRMLEKEMNEAVARFASGAAGGARAGVLALAFADRFVVESMRQRDRLVREVARFEREQLWLGIDVETGDGSSPFPDRHMRPSNERNGDWRRALGTLRPLLNGWVRIVEFELDVENAIARLAAGDAGEMIAAAVETCIYAFQKRGSLIGRTFRINEQTRSFLENCDQQRTVAEIIGPEVAPTHVCDLVRKLAMEQVITLR